MDQELQQLFLQSVTVNNHLVPRDWIFASVYIEKGRLNAPLLKLEVRDMTGTIIDDWGAKYGSTLVAEMGNPQGEEDTFKTTFFITSAALSGDVVTIVAVSEEVRTFKIPSSRTHLHTNITAAAIFQNYTGSLILAPVSIKRAMTYHLNAGEKPSRMFAAMARDKGALCWVCRGKFHFSTLTELAAQAAAFTYEANNPQAERTISKMRFINQDHAATAGNEYRFAGYSMTEGFVSYGNNDLPVKYISDPDMETLRNMQKKLVPKLDIEVAGNPEIQPGMVVEIQIFRYDHENTINESLPKKMIVMNVAHFEDRLGYNTRMILGVPNQ